MSRLKLLLLPALLTLPGCGVAMGVASAPFQAVKTGGKVVDVMTTSQSEQDEKRGRAIRQREERLGKLDRVYRKQSAKCQRGDSKACRKANQALIDLRVLQTSSPD